MDINSSPAGKTYENYSWLISGTALFLTLKLHLLSALLSGLLVYELVHVIAPRLRITRLSGVHAKFAAVSILAVTIVLLLVAGVWGLTAFLHRESGSIPALLHKMAEILEAPREMFPAWLPDYLPSDPDRLRDWAVQWLREHATELRMAGKEVGLISAHIVIGMVIGALISLREATASHEYRPLAKALVERTTRLGGAFRSVVFAQVRIAVLNTLFAGLYLVVLLPVLGIHLPLVKTMVIITFITGMLPVIGNLVSNTIIVVVSLSHSLAVAAASLVFLVVIHKLEYFLNARIVGAKINSRAWELLLAMLVMEAAFGVAGVIAVPVYYAYLRRQLADKSLI